MKINILGCNISAIASYGDAYKELLSYNFKNIPGYITVNNVHTVIEGVWDKEYGSIINNAFMALPDGKPLSVVAKMRGQKTSRIFGPTFLIEALRRSEQDGLKHFFFGSSEVTISKMREVMKEKYSKANIVGMISPPYRDLTDEENKNYTDEMNSKGADIIWVGLGAPKQEKWMSANYKKLNKGVMIGIGAGFDYLAGNISHAPNWMKSMSLEWLFRLIQEPKRLWKRYLITNSLFVYYNILEFLKLKKFN